MSEKISGGRVVCLLFQGETHHLTEMAEACYRWTPQIAVREGEALFLEISQCENLYKEETLLLRLQTLLRRFDMRAHLAVSGSPGMSLALARFLGFSSRPERLPVAAFYDVASPFKKDPEVEKQVGELLGILKKLGVETLGEFVALPPRALSSRFGFLGLELHKRLSGLNSQNRLSRGGSRTHDLWTSWPFFVPAEKITERVILHENENCENLEPLLFVMRTLLSRVVARLAGRWEKLTALELELELEKYSTVPHPRRLWKFQLPLPQGSVSGLLPVLQEKLQEDLARVPLASPVSAMEFRVLETVPGRSAQKNFFNQKEEEQEVWNSLMARLCQKLGKEHAFVASPVASYRPEKTWKKTWVNPLEGIPDLEGIDLPFPQRPLRLLKNPQPLFKIHNFLVQGNRGSSGDYGRGGDDDTGGSSGQRWEIMDWEGPERLTGEWWGEGFQRDYFRVGVRGGEQLWIFRIPETDHVFLHGFFD